MEERGEEAGGRLRKKETGRKEGRIKGEEERGMIKTVNTHTHAHTQRWL